MLVELTLVDGTSEDVNTDHIRSMRQENVAKVEEQPVFITTIRFINGGSEKYQGTRREIKAAFKQVGAR